METGHNIDPAKVCPTLIVATSVDPEPEECIPDSLPEVERKLNQQMEFNHSAINEGSLEIEKTVSRFWQLLQTTVKDLAADPTSQNTTNKLNKLEQVEKDLNRISNKPGTSGQLANSLKYLKAQPDQVNPSLTTSAQILPPPPPPLPPPPPPPPQILIKSADISVKTKSHSLKSSKRPATIKPADTYMDELKNKISGGVSALRKTKPKEKEILSEGETQFFTNGRHSLRPTNINNLWDSTNVTSAETHQAIVKKVSPGMEEIHKGNLAGNLSLRKQIPNQLEQQVISSNGQSRTANQHHAESSQHKTILVEDQSKFGSCSAANLRSVKETFLCVKNEPSSSIKPSHVTVNQSIGIKSTIENDTKLLFADKLHSVEYQNISPQKPATLKKPISVIQSPRPLKSETEREKVEISTETYTQVTKTNFNLSLSSNSIPNKSTKPNKLVLDIDQRTISAKTKGFERDLIPDSVKKETKVESRETFTVPFDLLTQIKGFDQRNLIATKVAQKSLIKDTKTSNVPNIKESIKSVINARNIAMNGNNSDDSDNDNNQDEWD